MHRNSNITGNIYSNFHNAGILNFWRLENVDNQDCYSCKNTFTFTGKEKDSLRLNPQSGGLCGAWLTNEGNNVLTTDGEKLYINYSAEQKQKDGEGDGSTVFSVLRHEIEHAVQFEYGELGFGTNEKGE